MLLDGKSAAAQGRREGCFMELSSLKVGDDVPWVTSWTGEPTLGVAPPCPSVGGALAIVQADNPGHGKPLY